MANRLHKRQKMKAGQREDEIAFILNVIPGASVEYLSQKIGAPSMLIRRDLKRMEKRRDQFPCLDAREKHYESKKLTGAHDIQMLIQYYKDYPGQSFSQACRDLNIDMNRLRTLVKKICVSGRGKSIQWPRTHGLTRHTKRQMILDLYTENPFITYDEIRQETGFNQNTTEDIMRELALEFQEVEMQRVGLWAQYIMREHLDIMDKCKEKFEACKQPTQGARWLELRQYSLAHVTKMLKLADQQSRLAIDVTFTKEEMDAPAKAIAQAMNFGKNLGQPLITEGAGDVIDV